MRADQTEYDRWLAERERDRAQAEAENAARRVQAYEAEIAGLLELLDDAYRALVRLGASDDPSAIRADGLSDRRHALDVARRLAMVLGPREREEADDASRDTAPDSEHGAGGGF